MSMGLQQQGEVSSWGGQARMGRAEAAERDLGFLLPATESPWKVDKPVSWVLFPSAGLVCEHRRGGRHRGVGGGQVC